MLRKSFHELHAKHRNFALTFSNTNYIDIFSKRDGPAEKMFLKATRQLPVGNHTFQSKPEPPDLGPILYCSDEPAVN